MKFIMTTTRPIADDRGATCVVCRHFYTTPVQVLFVLRFGFCMDCWKRADPDRRRTYDAKRERSALLNEA